MSGERVDPELVEVINRRMDVLAALSAPRQKRDLVDELDLSRSTVNRAVRQLESLGLVVRDGGYCQTVAGRLVADAYTEFVADLGDVVRMQGLLTALPPDAPMSLALTRGATVYRSSTAAPTASLDRSVEILRNASRVKVATPRISRQDIFEVAREEAEAGTEMEFVFGADLVEHTRDRRPEWVAAMADCESCSLHVLPGLAVNVGVARLPDGWHAGMVMYDSGGSFEGIVENDSLEAYAWGEAVFEEFRSAADPVEE
jgi:predicted transcriptional regulator